MNRFRPLIFFCVTAAIIATIDPRFGTASLVVNSG